jgi:hypothetical protein
MFIYVCQCIGLRNIVIMMYMYLTMLYPINDLNFNLNIASVSYRRQAETYIYILVSDRI